MEQEIKRQPVLINEAYLKAYSLFPENYDLKEVLNYIPIAQHIHIAPILGDALYEQLLDQVVENKLSKENSTLLLEVYKVLGVAVVFESLPFIYAHVSPTGITKGKSDNSDSISGKDLNIISLKLERQLEFEKQRLTKWLMQRSKYFPLYRPEGNGCCCNRNAGQRTLYSLPKICTEIY